MLEEIFDWLNPVSGVLSIASFILAALQAQKASKAASEVLKAKEVICQKQSTIELNIFLNYSKEIQQYLVNRVGPNKDSKQGYNLTKEHQKIEDFVSKLNEIRSLPNDDKIVTRLENEYLFFCNAKGCEVKPYEDMLYHVREIISIISKAIKSNIYT